MYVLYGMDSWWCMLYMVNVENVQKCAKCLPKCLSLSSQMFRDTGSRRFRIAKTTINSTAMPIVKSVPVNKAANGKIDRPKPPSVDEKEFKLIFIFIRIFVHFHAPNGKLSYQSYGNFICE